MRNCIFLLLTGLVLLTGCQREIDQSIAKGDSFNAQPVNTSLQGNIMDENGEPAADVLVKAGTGIVTTDAKGYFRITKTILDKNAALVTAEKTGYFKAYRTFLATSGTNQVIIKLTRKLSAGTVNAASGGEVSLSNGSTIALSPNGVVKASSGTPYAGTVTIYANYIDPTAIDIAETFPGSPMANDKDGKRVMLASYGMMNVELESAAGEKLQIAPGATAKLTTVIPASLQSSASPTIPLWYVNDQTGIWQEEGMATKNGNNYVGEVKHFSVWNCDKRVPAILLSVTVKNAERFPLVNACIRVRSWGSTEINGYAWTDSLGQINELMPLNQEIKLEVLDPCHAVIYTQSVGPLTENTELKTIYTSPATSVVTIKGKLTGCSGEKLTHTYAVVKAGNMTYLTTADNNGNFIASFMQCAGAQNTVQVFGVDAASLQQGTSVTIATRSPSVTDVGTIAACGTGLQEYINYSIDNVNYLILDSLDGYTIPNTSTTGSTSYIFGKDVMSPDHFSFQLRDGAVPGTYSFGSISFRYHSYQSTQQPIVTVTKFPQSAGQYYEGSFSWQFLESISGPATPHQLAGTFRVKRRF